MQSTSTLIEKIKSNTIQTIKINNQLGSSIKKLTESREVLSQALKIHAMPDEKDKDTILIVTRNNDKETPVSGKYIKPLVNIKKWDIAEQKFVAEHKIVFSGYRDVDYHSSVVLPKTNVLVIAHTGGVFGVYDLNTMEVKSYGCPPYSRSILELSESRGDLYVVTGERCNGILADGISSFKITMNLSGPSYYPGLIESSHLDLRSPTTSMIMSKNHELFSVQSHYKDNKKYLIHRYQDVNYESKLPGNFDKILKIVQNDSHETLFCRRADGSLAMILPKEYHFSHHDYPVDEVLSDIQFDSMSEKVMDVHVLEYKKNKYPDSLLVETAEADGKNHYMYFFKLQPRTKLGKINLGNHSLYTELKGNQFLSHEDDILGVSSFHDISTSIELDEILIALKENSSLTSISINDRILTSSNIDNICELKKSRPSLTIQLSPHVEQLIEAKLQLQKVAHEEKLKKDNKIKLTFELTKERQKNYNLVTELKLSIEYANQLEQKIAALNETQTSTCHEYEDQSKLKALEFFNKEKELKAEIHALHDTVDSLESEKLQLLQEYNKTLTMLASAPTTSKSLPAELYKAKTLETNLILQIVDQTQDIEGLSFIHFSDQSELQKINEDLRARGAILTVEDLLATIKAIKPPYNEKDKIERLTTAVEKLMIDYEEKSLPKIVTKTLDDLILPKIEEAIQSGEPEWLSDLYFTEQDATRGTLIDEFFTKSPNLEKGLSAELNKQFDHALKEIEAEHKHYRQYLKDKTELLLKIRFNDSDKKLKQLVQFIKEKMRKYSLNEQHKKFTLQNILTFETPELITFKHDMIIGFWENIKNKLNPLQKEVEKLQTEIAQLKKETQEYRLSALPVSLFSQLKNNSPDRDQVFDFKAAKPSAL